MSTNNLYRGLFEILTLPDGGAAAGTLLGDAGVARRDLVVVARQEGCLPELYARWAAENQLSSTESVEHEQFVRRRASVDEVSRGLPPGILLAAAVRSDSCPASIEVLLPDFAAIAPLQDAMGRLGYRLRGTGEWLVPPRGSMQRGLASFRYAATAKGTVAVDVQVGGVPIAAQRNLAFAELADGAFRVDGLSSRVLEPTRQVPHRIAAFGARATPVTLREIADLHLLLKDPAHGIDPAWLRARVEQLDAWTGLRKLREGIIAKRVGALLSWGDFGRLVEASATRGAAVAKRRAPDAGQIARSAFGLLASPRQDDIAARLARVPWLVSQVMGAGYRVRGVPVSSKAFDAPRFMRIAGALYLATGAGLILLSLVDLDDVARAGLGDRVRTGGRPVVLARWPAARAGRSSSSARAR